MFDASDFLSLIHSRNLPYRGKIKTQRVVGKYGIVAHLSSSEQSTSNDVANAR
jgi:hypothetical protein